MAVNFYLFPRPDKNGEHPIRVSISIKGVRLISTAGYNIGADKWDSNNQCVKRGFSNAKGVTYNFINARLKKIDSVFSDLENAATRKPTIDELAVTLAGIKGVAARTKQAAASIKEPATILEYFEQFVREESRQNQWTFGTMQCWDAFRKHLKAQDGIKDFSYFNERGIQSFVDYLRTDCNMHENTAQKHYKNLRWFLNWCIRKGYCAESDISKYRPKFKMLDKPVIFLTRKELLKLYAYEIPGNGEKVKLKDLNGKEYEKVIADAAALEKTRDMFCFCAFTSLRYSDMAKLKRTDISGNEISVTTKKTNDRLTIELNDYSAAILDKYKDRNFAYDLALPVISNQKMNDYIKDLGELCEFTEPITRVCYQAGKRIEETKMKWELLGTHAGRRTFICYALSVGIPPQVVMKWTGHSDYKAMKPYIDIAESTKAEAMKLFNETK